MKHPTSRMLFSYWDALRGERSAPERSEIQPAGLRHVLADAFVLGRDRGGPFAFRLAGTRIGALFMRDLRSAPFRALLPDGADRLVELVTNDTVGVVAGIAGRNVNGSELPLELLLLPLRHRGRPDTRMIGSLAPAVVPSWAGLVPMDGLSVQSVRVIDPARHPAVDQTVPTFAPPRRSPFTVLEGGRP